MAPVLMIDVSGQELPDRVINLTRRGGWMKNIVTIHMALLAIVSLTIVSACSGSNTLPAAVPIDNPPVAGEVEATEFMDWKLTPLNQQFTNALKGTQYINKESYKLTVDGLVDNPLTLAYSDLLSYPQISQLMILPCVEGWSIVVKWTGPYLSAIFNDAKVKPEAKIAIFHTVDVPSGYSSLDLQYIYDKNIIIGLKDNDITLSAVAGFPFQVVANAKFGYKWAKWINRIELSSDTNFRGYWESKGYSNNGDVSGPMLEKP
jgi:DMSO/TMAO reductase YedYZ molybdopterin-dependent catalytic subunit